MATTDKDIITYSRRSPQQLRIKDPQCTVIRYRRHQQARDKAASVDG